MDDTGIVPFYATYVQYPSGDVIGYFFAFCSLVPILLLCAMACELLSRREIETGILAAGQCVSLVLNYVLKRVIKQPRPHSDDYGMPSAHAQFFGYFSTYCILWTYTNGAHFPPFKRRLYYTVCLLGLACVPASRVYLGYHTIPQTVVGVLVGAGWGYSWLQCSVFLRKIGFLDFLLHTQLFKFFYIKDTALTRNFVAEEHREWLATTKKAQ
ncbi:hypothetical protein CANCADRAFT_4237 [Tortispora caseinolytica NRRL Y-17796]|uniref:Phosphatidic acid phosphatase type 2/haloperoxidase domain-containing protein n=1 Tax=Tortispora caseinolytica NRRL Y-17796 TaxID=767744 RepID=A0A1E4TD85_9ASCO|nr:hypothetical protein CANCADRAFT_4237 [Tortispora caseinolytica NRRL Y-17796]